MEVGSPDWIEASLAKLEELEQQRATHEHAIETVKEPLALRRHTDALGRLDAEIKALYAQLESFAEDDDEEEAEEEAAAAVATPERRTVGDETLSAPHIAAEAMLPMMQSAPLAAPISNAPAFSSPPSSPPASPPSAAPVSVAMPAPSPSYDDDIPTGGSGKWIFLGLVVVAGLGVGGFFMMQNMKKANDKPAPTAGSGEVIKAAEVPDDTEAPKAAKGADVDRTPTGNGAGTPAPTKKDTKKDATKKVIKLGDDGDPLG